MPERAGKVLRSAKLKAGDPITIPGIFLYYIYDDKKKAMIRVGETQGNIVNTKDISKEINMAKKIKKGLSARSKKMDQLWLSRAELRKNGVDEMKLSKLTRAMGNSFGMACLLIFGTKWYKRLRNSADRANKSPIGYAADVLLK